MTHRPTLFDQAFRIGMGLIFFTGFVLVARQLAWAAPDAGGVIKVAVLGLFPFALGVALMTRPGFPRFLGLVVAVLGAGWAAFLWSQFA